MSVASPALVVTPQIIHSPLRRRLWLAAAASVLFLVTLFVANAFLPPERAAHWNMLGYDFRALYIAGSFARDGRYADFYDVQAVARADTQIAADYHLDINQGVGPIFNPPFFAWMFAPLARYPYPTALKLWYAISLACLAASLLLLGPMLGPHASTSDRLLLAALTLTSMPAVAALLHAQNSFVSLLMLATTVAFWRSDRALAAGLTAGLLFYKPHLALVLAIALVVTAGRRALLGLLLTGVALLLVNLLTLPGTLGDFLLRMPANLRWLQETHDYAWYRHATFNGFFRTLIQGTAPGPATSVATALSWTCLLATAAMLTRLLLRARKLPLDRVIAATILCIPLLTPFYFDYDLLLLCIPAALTAAADRSASFDRWLPTAWTILAISTILNTPVAQATRFAPTVSALCLVAWLTCRKAW